MATLTRTALADGILLVRFETQYDLASTFLRFQEHYESSRFAGRVFSLEQFMDWYATTFGKFTYYEDWAGFNIPSSVLEPFYNGKFDPLLEKEKRLLRLFRHERSPFYVIGVLKNSPKGDLTHEFAHAIFFTNPRYRRAVLTALRAYDTSRLRKKLLAMGYHRRVATDEVHAYLIAPADELGSLPPALAPLRRRLKALFLEHAPRSLSQARSRTSRRDR